MYLSLINTLALNQCLFQLFFFHSNIWLRLIDKITRLLLMLHHVVVVVFVAAPCVLLVKAVVLVFIVNLLLPAKIVVVVSLAVAQVIHRVLAFASHVFPDHSQLLATMATIVVILCILLDKLLEQGNHLRGIRIHWVPRYHVRREHQYDFAVSHLFIVEWIDLCE